MTRVTEHALKGDLIPSYDGGLAERDGIIDAMARWPVSALTANVSARNRELEATWAAVRAPDWELPILMWHASLAFTVLTRWREAWIHALDLNLGLTSSAWPEDFAGHAVSFLLRRLPAGVVIVDASSARRWDTGGQPLLTVSGDVRDIAAWLADRGSADSLTVSGELVELAPWPVDPATPGSGPGGSAPGRAR